MHIILRLDLKANRDHILRA